MNDDANKTEDPIIKIDGEEYKLSSLSEETRAQINNLKIVDAEIVRLQQKTAIAQTARIAYVESLKSSLPNKD